MVYLHFPSNLTEEELMLQTKYQKLKKKKKAIHALKSPKTEPDKPLILKRPADARDAREVARKLLKSGAIQAIQKPVTKQEQTSFKRPKERKRVPSDSGIASYQPFSSTQETVASPTAATNAAEKETPQIQNLYQQFANERDQTEKKVLSDASRDTPRKGYTIYVSGNKVTEDFLKKHFSAFGTISNVSMEIEKGRGFVTFKKTESADKAISEMHNKTIFGIQLQVQMARRQPQPPINDASSAVCWSTVAASNSQKGSHKDTRAMVDYSDNAFFDAS